MDALVSQGPSSVRELASAVGRQPEALYYHIHALRKLGLVEEHATRKGRRRSETVYALVAQRLVIDRRQRSPEYLAALAGTCDALLRATAREYRDALGQPGAKPNTQRAGLVLHRFVAGLDRDRLRRLHELLEQIDGLFDTSSNEPGHQTYGLTVVLTPVETFQKS